MTGEIKKKKKKKKGRIPLKMRNQIITKLTSFRYISRIPESFLGLATIAFITPKDCIQKLFK